MTIPVFGVAGWKNSGKTTLCARLITEFTARGYKVAAVKHTHHSFDIDHPGRDSFKFREAGAREVAVVSASRWALVTELRGEDEPPLEDVLARLEGSDLVIAEGFKFSPHPKIETRRREAESQEPLSGQMPNIVAMALGEGIATDSGGLPQFDLSDTGGIAAFIERHLGLRRRT